MKIDLKLYVVGLAALMPLWMALGAAPQLPGGFTQINMLDGGYLPVIVQHWSGRLVGRTDGGGIYSSDNHGASWTFLSGDMKTPAALLVQGVAVPQTTGSSSNLILQACGVGYLNTDPGRGIWKTTNGGLNWTQTLSGVNFSGGDQERVGGECMVFNPTNDSEVWAGSRGQGLYESTKRRRLMEPHYQRTWDEHYLLGVYPAVASQSDFRRRRWWPVDVGQSRHQLDTT